MKERMRQGGTTTKFDCFDAEKLIFIHGAKPQLRTYKVMQGNGV